MRVKCGGVYLLSFCELVAAKLASVEWKVCLKHAVLGRRSAGVDGDTENIGNISRRKTNVLGELMLVRGWAVCKHVQSDLCGERHPSRGAARRLESGSRLAKRGTGRILCPHRRGSLGGRWGSFVGSWSWSLTLRRCALESILRALVCHRFLCVLWPLSWYERETRTGTILQPILKPAHDRIDCVIIDIPSPRKGNTGYHYVPATM
jgi:hypothetical protein